jgi:hypothetical protein
MLKTGQAHEIRRSYEVRGVDRHLFGYPWNNNRSHTTFPLDATLDSFIELLLFRGVVKNAYPNDAVSAWRKQENISLNTYRMLSFPEERPESDARNEWYLDSRITRLKKYVGKDLNEEFFKPKYESRINPKITGISFSTCGCGYVIQYTFSFENFNYKHGWSKGIAQKEGESIDMFVCRAYREIDSVLK